MGKLSDPARLKAATEDAQWIAETLSFLAEAIGGKDTDPEALSGEARAGLANILRQCEDRAWNACTDVGLFRSSMKCDPEPEKVAPHGQ